MFHFHRTWALVAALGLGCVDAACTASSKAGFVCERSFGAGANAVTLYWKVASDRSQASFALETPTEGYSALGFAPRLAADGSEKFGRVIMDGAQIVVGESDSDVRTRGLDQFGGDSDLAVDDDAKFTEASTTKAGGKRTLQFTRTSSTNIVDELADMKVLYAYHTSVPTLVYHSHRDSFDLDDFEAGVELA